MQLKNCRSILKLRRRKDAAQKLIVDTTAENVLFFNVQIFSPWELFLDSICHIHTKLEAAHLLCYIHFFDYLCLEF